MRKDEERMRKDEFSVVFRFSVIFCFDVLVSLNTINNILSLWVFILTKLITNDHFLEDLTNRYMIGKCMFLLSYFQMYFRLCYQPCVFSQASNRLHSKVHFVSHAMNHESQSKAVTCSNIQFYVMMRLSFNFNDAALLSSVFYSLALFRSRIVQLRSELSSHPRSSSANG